MTVNVVTYRDYKNFCNGTFISPLKSDFFVHSIAIFHCKASLEKFQPHFHAPWKKKGKIIWANQYSFMDKEISTDIIE